MPALNRDSVRNFMYNLYKCKEGSWLRISNPQPARYWGPFIKAMGLDYVLEDPRFQGVENGTVVSDDLLHIIEDQFATKTFEEWDQIFRQYGFIYAKVQSIEDLKYDPQVIANDYITDFDHPAIGPIKVCNFPVAYSETPASIWKEAPELGQDTESILIDELGYDWSDIENFQNAGAIL